MLSTAASLFLINNLLLVRFCPFVSKIKHFRKHVSQNQGWGRLSVSAIATFGKRGSPHFLLGLNRSGHLGTLKTRKEEQSCSLRSHGAEACVVLRLNVSCITLLLVKVQQISKQKLQNLLRNHTSCENAVNTELNEIC